MKLHILGTAASEGWPAVFCRCDACQRARSLGGRNIRTRAGALINGQIKIDFGPDTYMQSLRDGVDLGAIEYLFLTHSHHDHLVADDLETRQPPYAWNTPKPLRIYGHDKTLDFVMNALHHHPGKHYALSLLQPLQEVAAGDVRVVPLRADHDPRETCLIYLFEQSGRRLLWGHDTGLFPDDTMHWLQADAAAHGPLSTCILDCTNGPLAGTRNHMGFDGLRIMRERLLKSGIASLQTRFVATHFSHNGKLLHDELTEALAPLGFDVAYDGLVIEV